MTRRGGIRRQLQWLGVIPALIMLILVLVSLTWQRFQDADNEVRQLGGFLAQQLAGSAEYGVLSGNLSDLRRQANMVLARPDVQYVQFRDQDGEPLLRAGLEADRVVGEDVLEFHAGIYRQPVALDPAFGDGRPARPDRIGEVVLGVSRGRILARQKEIIGTSLLPALLAMVVGLFSAGYLARQIADPISYLSGLVRVIRGGDYHVRGVRPLSGELGHLQTDINELAASLDQAQSILDEKLGATAPLFAYPYGEYDSALEEMIDQRGWLAYGQQSGAIGQTSDTSRLPRYPLTTAHGQLDGLDHKLRSRSLPVIDDAPGNSIVQDNPPELSLTLPDGFRTGALTCFASGQGRIPLTADQQTVSVRAPEPFSSRRFRYNCTYPAGDGRFYWFSRQWVDLSRPED